MKERKTVDYLVIIGNYGYGWDYIEAAPYEDKEEIKDLLADLKSYRENETDARFKTVFCRFKKDNNIYHQLRMRNYKG